MSKNYDLMCDHFWSLNSINLFIEHNQNFTSFGSLALILWFPYTHAKDISNKIHSIISCPQTISLSIFCNVGRSMYLTCVHVKIQNALTKSYTHQIMKYNKKIHLKMTLCKWKLSTIFFIKKLVLKFWWNIGIWLNLHLKPKFFLDFPNTFV